MLYDVYYAVLILLLAGMLWVGIYQTRKVKTSADFLVAGRSLSAPVLVATLLCSWIGAGSLFGGAELAYEEGLAALWFPAGGWAGLIVIYFLAGRVRKFAQFTVPDLLETRYGIWARLMGTLCIIVSYTAIVSYQFKGGGRILNLAFGIDERQGMLIVAVFVIVFTALAGMSSVAYVDLVVGAMVTIGCLTALPLLLGEAGGWENIKRSLPPSHMTALGSMSGLEALGYFLPTFMLLIGNQNIYQKFFSARTERDARVSVAGWLVGTLILETAIVLLAVIGGVLYRTQIEQGEFPAWGIIPYSARHGMVAWVGAFFLGSVLAQVISTGNNYLFSPATTLVHDLYHRFINRATPDRRLLLYSRLAVVLLGVVAFLQSFQPSVLETAVYAYDVYGAGITPAVLAAFFWKRATGAGGLASILAGTATAVVWKIFGALDPGTASPLLARLSQITDDIPMIYPALAASLICLVGVSLLTPRPREEQWKPFFK